MGTFTLNPFLEEQTVDSASYSQTPFSKVPNKAIVASNILICGPTNTPKLQSLKLQQSPMFHTHQRQLQMTFLLATAIDSKVIAGILSLPQYSSPIMTPWTSIHLTCRSRIYWAKLISLNPINTESTLPATILTLMPNCLISFRISKIKSSPIHTKSRMSMD